MTVETNFGTGEERYRLMHDLDFPGGVVVDPTPITAGEEITIFYNGPLAQTGAPPIYLHVGYGPGQAWRRISDLRMAKTGWGWVKTLEIPIDEDRLNFCFRDSANNWDNNGGVNWSYEIHQGKLI